MAAFRRVVRRIDRGTVICHRHGLTARMGRCVVLIEQAARRRPCPHVGWARVNRCGEASGLQCVRCLYCGRSYNALTVTPRARPEERALAAYLQCRLDTHTVREAARTIDVNFTTRFSLASPLRPGERTRSTGNPAGDRRGGRGVPPRITEGVTQHDGQAEKT